jgi:uracil-DNA glycosylase
MSLHPVSSDVRSRGDNLYYQYNVSLIDHPAQVIAQQCYCDASHKGAKGLALSIKEKYPYADFYSNREKSSTPGTIKVAGTKTTKFIVALFAQLNPGLPKDDGSPYSRSSTNDDSHFVRPSTNDCAAQREKWFKMCLDRVSKIKNLRSIAFPYNIGCGLAGGDWNKYEDMLEQFAFSNPQVSVYIVSNISRREILPDPNKYINVDEVRNKYGLQSYEDITAETLLRIIDETLNPPEDVPTGMQEDAGNYDPETPENGRVPSWNEMSLVDYVVELSESSDYIAEWTFFKKETDIEYGTLPSISSFLEAESKKGVEIYPPLHLVLQVFCLIRPSDVKVIVIGQDPYHAEVQAMGISFSVPDEVAIPSSLINIYKELKDDGFKPGETGNLTKWVERGVLLINTALTVEAHQPNSHSKVWHEYFTPALMRYLNLECPPSVIIMWGSPAQNFSKYFSDEKHRKITSVHPSGLSANRGFFGSKPFSKANSLLKSLGREPIDWGL